MTEYDRQVLLRAGRTVAGIHERLKALELELSELVWNLPPGVDRPADAQSALRNAVVALKTQAVLWGASMRRPGPSE